MSAFTPGEGTKMWKPQQRQAGVQLYLTGANGDSGALAGARACGLPLELSLVPVTDWIDPEELSNAAIGVVQVDAETPASMKRFQKLAASTDTPLIAAAYEPPLALVRSLLRAGAHDVLPLPLDLTDLETSIRVLLEQQSAETQQIATSGSQTRSRVISIVKTVGGVGATSIATQLAVRFAEREANAGRDTCLIDLDMQFGDAAFQLGLRPNLSVSDLLEAGARLDGALVRATASKHSSGLNVIASPAEMMPLEGISSDQILQIVDTAAREFGTVFLEVPTNWTNWSLSLLARSDLILLVADLTIPSLHRARRQLELMASQGLQDLEVRIVANRFEKTQLKTIRQSDVRDALGRDIAYTVANEPGVMRVAADRGVTIAEVKRRSAIGKDLDALDSAIAAFMGLER
jgi:pilus assembly protein CpaE